MTFNVYMPTTFGEPAEIAATKESRTCGRCGGRLALYERTRLIAGIDFAYQKRYITAACCADCGFAF